MEDWEYSLGDKNNLFGDTNTDVRLLDDGGNSIVDKYTSDTNALTESLLNSKSSGFDWENVLSSSASSIGKNLGSLLGLLNKNKYEKDYLSYLKDKAKKELLADLIRTKLTGQKKESSTSRHTGFGPTAPGASLGSGRASISNPFPQLSSFNPKLASYLLGALRG